MGGWTRTSQIYNLRTMDEIIAETKSTRAYRCVLLALFSGLALPLGRRRTAGVMSYLVAQRTQIGISSRARRAGE